LDLELGAVSEVKSIDFMRGSTEIFGDWECDGRTQTVEGHVIKIGEPEHRSLRAIWNSFESFDH
jgi:hypothetical protein